MAAKNVERIASTLSELYRDHAHHNRRNPLDELLFILCSTQTNETNYMRSFRLLKKRFPTFTALADASIHQIANELRVGGLSNRKAREIKRTLARIRKVFGECSLRKLQQQTDAECESFLTSLPGVGLKTARCVMLYSLNRQVFPVDVHCWRIGKRLGWVRERKPHRPGRAQDAERLQNKIPKPLRFSLHVNFVSLGREYCTNENPRCAACPIRQYCGLSLKREKRLSKIALVDGPRQLSR